MEIADDGQRAAEVARKLKLLDSLYLQNVAWSHVTQTTIINCYKQASIAPESDEEAGTSSD